MCEVRSREKRPRTKKKKKYNGQQQKEMDCHEPHPAPNEKIARHPVDRTANWCIGGCWFTLAGNHNAQTERLTTAGRNRAEELSSQP
jgi:hypothetical protein